MSSSDRFVTYLPLRFRLLRLVSIFLVRCLLRSLSASSCSSFYSSTLHIVPLSIVFSFSVFLHVVLPFLVSSSSVFLCRLTSMSCSSYIEPASSSFRRFPLLSSFAYSIMFILYYASVFISVLRTCIVLSALCPLLFLLRRPLPLAVSFSSYIVLLILRYPVPLESSSSS